MEAIEAIPAQQEAPGGIKGFLNSPNGRKILLSVGAALVIALMAGIWMWSAKPEYKVLFSNFNDKDGGAIVAALQQMNVPYKYSDGGVAILVPADQVHDVRLKLAGQGLPKGGGVGFELMENQKLGVSQFLEQVNYQRALEGELARSIQSIGAVQTARVHLAMPKSTVFVREQQKPTASVLLNLHAGRVLDQQQVSAIVHLVASSVPDLPAKNVTVVDQDGNLLTGDKPANANNTLDATQLKYVQELQDNIARRVEAIVTPVVGPNNVHAEATADVDFSRVEQAAETYKPNGKPDAASIRSQQSSESSGPGGNGASGVPGALSNQPQANATAPVNGQTPPPNATAANGQPPAASTQSRRDSTINYEVDKTVRYVQQPMGGLRRLSVAVVLNYRTEIKNGKPVSRPLTDAEKTQITDLIREAMGFSKDRGDSLSVLNTPFVTPEKEAPPVLPIWKNPDNIALAKEIGRYLLPVLLLLYLFFGVLRPMLKKLNPKPEAPALPPAVEGTADELVDEEDEDAVVSISGEAAPPKVRSYQENLEAAKALARQDPRMVANIVKNWIEE
ncbi:flagellar basal-body MS-ring/collar protein FliF [Noviherbaspirillum pedocola]|uniref:Flagellar M-ring protein n=1 Tax=Noviherbaspirillum pedocola TaxID=2801341 RepID=A0A934SYP8_9BURK|nr:flagellar basal-body MS-ring/collar protein FliF [Noviherbaspirillum pedocola]MBK4739306.1 flagellar M-ring protein FliF [Noviherbaspirillum pedocola]